MNKNKYINKCYKVLSKYSIEKYQYDELCKQICDVVYQTEGDLRNTLGTPEDFVSEILEINDISANLKKHSFGSFKEIDWNSKIIGFVLIVMAFVYLTTETSLYDIVLYGLGGSLILIGLSMIFKRNFIQAVIFIIIGGYILPARLDITNIFGYNFGFTIIVTVILVTIGLKLLFGPNKKRKYYYDNAGDYNYGSSDFEEYFEQDRVVLNNKLGKFEKSYTNEEISKMEINCSLGNTVINLSNFEFNKGDLEIDINSNLGELTILTPPTCKVSNNVFNKNGKISNLRASEYSESDNLIVIVGESKNGHFIIK